MSILKETDKKILEKVFNMEKGYVLDFSDRTIEEFFKNEFGISIYDEKYDLDFPSKSKANRLRGIWIVEDGKTTGTIILNLIEYLETNSLLNGKKIDNLEKELIEKARQIGMSLISSYYIDDLDPGVQKLKNKTEIVKDFNSFDYKNFETNKKIYLIKVLFSYYENIIASYYGTGLFFASSGIDDLNDYFKILRKKIMEIVSSDDTFVEIKNSDNYGNVFEPMTSLYISAEFLDVIWGDTMLPSIISLREEISDKDLYENNFEIHKFSFSVSNFLKAISKEIIHLQGIYDQNKKKFYKEDIPGDKEKSGSSFGGDQTVKHKHEHTHHFENSIQEKDININHKYEKGGEPKFYITKINDDFKYNGKLIGVSKNNDPYKVFCALYDLANEGGEVSFKDLIIEVKSRIPKMKHKTTDEMQKFINDNLTTSNGFMKKNKIKATEDNGKPLIYNMHGYGIMFNNQAG